MSLVDEDVRREQLANALATVEARLQRACATAGRPRNAVQLIAVTKTFPASDVALLADLGLRDFGENRDQEATAKVAELEALRPGFSARWHMVGRLQRNKVRSVVSWATVLQSVDSLRLVNALDVAVAHARAAGRRDGPLEVLAQVSLDTQPDRGGCSMADLPKIAQAIAQSSELTLRGVMAVAPLMGESAEAFSRLTLLSQQVIVHHPGAREVSAGMSGDLEQAVAHGATWVRVGTALLGGRGLASS